MKGNSWFSVSKINSPWANLILREQISWAIFFYEQFSWAVSNFFEDASSKIIALADPILSQPDMEGEMVSHRTGASIPSVTIHYVLPDLPAIDKWTTTPLRRIGWCHASIVVKLYCTTDAVSSTTVSDGQYITHYSISIPAGCSVDHELQHANDVGWKAVPTKHKYIEGRIEQMKRR